MLKTMRAVCQVSLKVSPSVVSAAEFLDTAPRGAYTTARTIKGSDRVFELHRHLDRLATSSRPFLKGAASEADVTRIALRAVDELLTGSKAMLDASDCKLTVVIAFGQEAEGAEIQALTHLEPMKAKDTSKPIYVALGGPPRSNAIVKDSKWVHDRKAVVDQAAEETLLLGDGGNSILEGSQTNFFAVMPSGVVMTAGSGVLEGTVRAVVIDACRELNIPLQFESPKVDNIDTFAEAFLASTSRLVMPIDQLGARKLPIERPITSRISDWVRKHVEDRSVSVRSLVLSMSSNDLTKKA